MMVTLLGGDGSVGLRVYSNCRSYYYLQFTLSMYSDCRSGCRLDCGGLITEHMPTYIQYIHT